MPRIFDNIELPLLPAWRDTLAVSTRGDFCVGYFNLRGWRQVDDLVARWPGGGDGQASRVIVCGFHSPLEQRVLRRKGHVVKVLARGMSDYRPAPEKREPLTAGQILAITAFPPDVRSTTRDTAPPRNRVALALASEIVTPHASDGSSLAALRNERGAA